MNFNSLSFVFIFLPLTVGIYFLIPAKLDKLRMIFILIASLLFYIWGDASNLYVLLLSIVFNYASSREIGLLKEEGEDHKAKIALTVTVVMNVLMLSIFKYSSLLLPIGISFYTFSALSYVFDVYYERVEADENLFTAAFYMLFFPKVVSGPVAQYKDFKDQIEHHEVKKTDLAIGGHLFIIGLFKKVLLADQLGVAFALVHAEKNMSGFTAILGMVMFSLQLYFDFSGYSDMAIGLSRVLGFKVEKNFDYPYTSENMTEFWRRWHISLGAWFRDYVYIPLGGNRVSTGKFVRNIAIVWILTGIWHGSTLNYPFWGLYIGAFVLMDKFVFGEGYKRLPHIVKAFLTNLVVFCGWVFFFSSDLGDAFSYFGKMLCLDGGGLVDKTFFYYVFGNFFLLVASFLCVGPFLNKLHSKLVFKKDSTATYISIALHVLLFLFTVAFMVSSTYTTFLYARF